MMSQMPFHSDAPTDYKSYAGMYLVSPDVELLTKTTSSVNQTGLLWDNMQQNVSLQKSTPLWGNKVFCNKSQ